MLTHPQAAETLAQADYDRAAHLVAVTVPHLLAPSDEVTTAFWVKRMKARLAAYNEAEQRLQCARWAVEQEKQKEAA